jgi:hypothetical protein
LSPVLKKLRPRICKARPKLARLRFLFNWIKEGWATIWSNLVGHVVGHPGHPCHPVTV